MSHPVMNNLETRIKAIEDRLQILDMDVESLRREISLSNSLGQERNLPSIASGVADPHERNVHLFISQYDSFIQNDYMRHISLSCFVLGAALLLRYTTEHNILPSSTGVLVGMMYSYLLVGLACIFPAKYLPVRRLVGVLGLVLLHLIIIESSIHFHALGEESVFWLLLLSMMIALGLSSNLRAPSVREIAMGLLPLVLFIVSYPNISYPDVCLLYLIASFPILFLPASSTHSFSRILLGCVILIVLFSWNRDLNFAYHNSKFFDSERLVSFVFYVSAFSALFLLRSIYCPLREMEPSRSDIWFPSLVLLFLYFFARHHFIRASLSLEDLDQLFLFLSSFLIAAGIFIGYRSQGTVKSAVYLVLPSLCLFFVSSAFVFSSWNRLILLWSGMSLVMYVLSYRLKNSALHGLSYVLQAASLIGILAVLAVSPASSIPVGLYLFLTGALFTQYFIHRSYSNKGVWIFYSEWINRLVVFFLLGGIVFSSYFLGESLIERWSDSPDFNRCLQSIVLTLLASLVLLAGERQKEQDILFIGSVVFAFAALKTFLLDPLLGIGEFFVLSMITFGTILGIDAYVFQQMRKKSI